MYAAFKRKFHLPYLLGPCGEEGEGGGGRGERPLIPQSFSGGGFETLVVTTPLKKFSPFS